MKINHDYLKGLLEAFEAADKPFTDIIELKGKGFNYEDDNLIFHLLILNDQQFVKPVEGHELGYHHSADGSTWSSIIRLRLTAQGHEFLEALRHKEVWNTIKAEFKEASISTLWKISRDLFEGYTQKKIRELIGE